MKRIKHLFLALSLFGLLISCGPQSSAPVADDEGPDEVAEELKMPTSVTSFELDDTDYSSLEDEPTKLIRIHYRRKDANDTYSNYKGWRIWGWDVNGGNGWWYEFTKYNAYGVICDIPVNEVAADKTSITKLGTVVTTCSSTTATWTGSYNKDPDSDLFADIDAVSPGGIQRLYITSGVASYFYSQEAVFMSTLNVARIVGEKLIRLTFSTHREDFKVYPKRLEVKVNGKVVDDYELEETNITKTGGTYQATAALRFSEGYKISDNIEVSYRIASDNIQKVKAIMTNYYDLTDFAEKYNYEGNDLGATFDNEENPSKTTFKVWTPVSSKVILNIYSSGDYRVQETPRQIEMNKMEKGVWGATVDEDLDGKYYTYTVTNSAGTNEVVDPYAKSAGLNGKRGMVVNFTKLNKEIEGWASDTRPDFGAPTDASIYEIHVRDMTINPNSGVKEENRGKVLGLAEEGTKYEEGGKSVSTGLDHLAELGITHVQIQPFYDYSSVDESTLDVTMGKDNYNWGYDPQNYNALEGSYSTNPCDGYNRIKEFKQMVMALHNKGINIIMDVVYNHTAAFGGSNFELLVPNYYHRTNNAGTPYNGSGCGNEVASDRFMVNKFIRESTKFWTEQYHLAGFRFDLMGLMDNQVMIDIYNDNVALFDKILIFGEPWTGGSTKLVDGTNPEKLASQKTVQNSLDQAYFAGNNVLVGAFSDGFRNSARGDNSPGKGYVTGSTSDATGLIPGIKGMFGNGNTRIQPQQVVNYVSCHDNYTLFDQFMCGGNASGRDFPKVYSQAETLVFTSQGLPFMQEGEDFMRTKYDVEAKEYIHNSYNVGDLINNMDYALKLQNVDMFNYFKALIAFRKATPVLHLASRDAIAKALVKLETYSSNGGLIEYVLKDGSDEYLILHTVNTASYKLETEYEVLFTNVDYEIGSKLSGDISLGRNVSLVLKK